MGEYWWAFMIFWWTCGAINALIVSSIVRFKRPRRCGNCRRRPRWAFDTSARNGNDLLRDHMKACLA